MNLNEDGDEIDVVTLMDQLTKEGTLSGLVVLNI